MKFLLTKGWLDCVLLQISQYNPESQEGCEDNRKSKSVCREGI